MPEYKELTPFERFHIFKRAWRSGATTGNIDEAALNHPNPEVRALWDEGYKRGREDRIKIDAELCKRFKYKPNILRATDAVL